MTQAGDDRAFDIRMEHATDFERTCLASAAALADKIERRREGPEGAFMLAKEAASRVDVFVGVYPDDDEPSGFGLYPLKGGEEFERYIDGAVIVSKVAACLCMDRGHAEDMSLVFRTRGN